MGILEKMNIKSILCATAFLTALAIAYTIAGASDTTDWERQAKQNWTAEHGDAQPDLTPESEKYLTEMTALLQVAKDKEQAK